MATTPTPALVPYADAPQRSEATDRAAYALKADAWAASLPAGNESVRAVALAAEANAEYAENRATAAASSASAASTARTGAETAQGLAEDARDEAQGYASSALGAPGTNATSTTSRSLGTGSKAFTLAQTGKLFTIGQTVVVTRTSDVTKRMTGPITSFAADVLTVDVQLVNGSGGPYTDWTIALSAPPLTDIASQAEAEAGTVTDKLMTPERTAQAISALGRFAPDVIVQDQKSSGTAGSSLTATGWRDRTLNTVVRNVGSIGALSSNILTLPAGTWLLRAKTSIIAVSGPVNYDARARFYNDTDGAVIAQGENNRFADGAVLEVMAIVTLSGSKGVKLQTYVIGSDANSGAAVSTGDVEVYATVEATRLS